jgi:uroporphyrin-III C-methyltransferase/precorrin-2 dehydrogenase/sirohydrochlorin ferrochelatase
MGSGQAGEVVAAMLAHGARGDLPVAVVENAGRADRSWRVGRLADLPGLAEGGSGGPAVILIGEVVRACLQSGSAEAEAERAVA